MFRQSANFNGALEPWKSFSEDKAVTLLATAREQAGAAAERNHKTPIRDYLIVDIGLSTGLRVMEIAQLKCGDIFMREGTLSLLVRCGKGGKRRLVRFARFAQTLAGHLAEYMV